MRLVYRMSVIHNRCRVLHLGKGLLALRKGLVHLAALHINLRRATFYYFRRSLILMFNNFSVVPEVSITVIRTNSQVTVHISELLGLGVLLEELSGLAVVLGFTEAKVNSHWMISRWQGLFRM